MRTIVAVFGLVFLSASPGWGQELGSAADVQKGRDLAVLICANCHVAARNQRYEPILRPPAPSFESIAQRKNIDATWLEAFLATTHRGLDNQNGMPNPELLDDQIKKVAAYVLSLRKNP
jgi:mono/diheme cytochrome c family protein